MAVKTEITDSYWTSPIHVGGHGGYDNSFGWELGYGGKNLGENYQFDPKNPPAHGCTDYHPPLDIIIGNKTSKIYGSSCIKPIVDDADIYVSLDSFAKFFDWEHPWSNSNKKHIRMFINDGSVPENQVQFENCINYVIKQLKDDKKVHAGCIAGHGRTGLFLSAVVQKTMGEQLKEEGISAIDYVRDNYCGKAVETFKQVLYLYGMYDVEPPIKQAQKMKDFEDIFIEEMGVDFRTVLKETTFAKINPIVLDIENKIFAKYAKIQVTPQNTKPTAGLSKEELEEIFYNCDLKFGTENINIEPTDSQLLLPYEPSDLSLILLEEENPFKDYPTDADSVTVATPINDRPKFSFGKK